MTQQEALSQLQRTELEILLVIRDFCENNGIAWFLDGGSALGAVRHKGFIPWDDDIDIGMLREDYDRFLSLAEDGLPEGYSLHTARNTPGYAALFAKVYKDGTRFETQETRDAGCPQGIFVDVFPYDRLPADGRSRSQQITRASLAQKISYLYCSRSIQTPHSGLLGTFEKAACWVAHYVLRAFHLSPERMQSAFDKNIIADGRRLSDKCLSLVWPNMEPLKTAHFEHLDAACFEGHSMPVPSDVEAYLKNMYGEWWVLPAPEKRHTHLPLLLDFGNGDSWKAE